MLTKLRWSLAARYAVSQLILEQVERVLLFEWQSREMGSRDGSGGNEQELKVCRSLIEVGCVHGGLCVEREGERIKIVYIPNIGIHTQTHVEMYSGYMITCKTCNAVQNLQQHIHVHQLQHVRLFYSMS